MHPENKKTTTMKRYLLALMAAAAMLFSSCNKDEQVYFLQESMWRMTNAPATYEAPTIAFSGNLLWINRSNSYVSPLADGEWKYYITEENNELHMKRYYFDEDGNERHESVTFQFDVADDGSAMQLIYNPLLGSRRVYEFERI